MGLETGDTIASLNASWPLGSDPKSQGDDHLRLVKTVMKADALSKAVGGTVAGTLIVAAATTTPLAIDNTNGTHSQMLIRSNGANVAALGWNSSVAAFAIASDSVATPANHMLRVGNGVLSLCRADALSYIETQFSNPAAGAQHLVIRRGLGGTGIARFDTEGPGTGGATTVMTREKGDARYTLSSSDAALKQDVADMAPMLAQVRTLRPVSFTWIPDATDPKPAGTQLGLIAQEVAGVIPSAVGGVEGHRTLDALTLIGVLVKAVQELADRVEALEA